MKHIFLIFLAVLFGILTHAQTQYEISGEGANKILKGIVSRDLMMNDPVFAGTEKYAVNNADPLLVKLLHEKENNISFIVFGGSWSSPTRELLPSFFSLMDMSAFPEDHITLVAVDSTLHSTASQFEYMHIEAVPAIVVLENGRELARISGNDCLTGWNQALYSILQTAQ